MPNPCASTALSRNVEMGWCGDEDHFRTQFPTCLAWALTVWKSQEMTIPGLLAILLGDVEKVRGLTFVALSRSTDVNNVFLGPGCPFERLTTRISSDIKLRQRLVEDDRLQLL
jgi:ATP-dependent exoDNAse (exonuclease V) alpha subunit